MDLQRLTSYLRQGIQKYHMIEEGDKIAVGLSGGKDSLTLLMGLQKLATFYPKKYDLVAIYVDLGIHQNNTFPTDLLKEPSISSGDSMIETLSSFCRNQKVPFYPVTTQIYDIVFQERKEKNPCSLCAKMRKGSLNEQALALGCNKVAYAHHMDDFIETSMMSLLIEGRYDCFPPVTHLEKTGLTVIRPMICIPEQEIIGFAKRNRLPVIKNPCPADGFTKRQETKEWIEASQKYFPDIRKNLNSALLKYFEVQKDECI